MSQSPGYHVLSQPLRVEWAGWTSDTRRLQQSGWDISAHEEPYDNRLIVAMRHEQFGMRGLSQVANLDYMQSLRDSPYASGLPLVRLHSMASHYNMNFPLMELRMDTGFNFNPIDAQPQLRTYMGEPYPGTFDELCHFAKVGQSRQIIVPPDEDVNQLLERILQKQEGARQSYFEEKVQRERNAGPVPTVHAQILQFDRRAVA